MFLDYDLQYELANQHRQELEALAAQTRLIVWAEKPKMRIWSFTTWLNPRIIGAEVSRKESHQVFSAR